MKKKEKPKCIKIKRGCLHVFHENEQSHRKDLHEFIGFYLDQVRGTKSNQFI